MSSAEEKATMDRWRRHKQRPDDARSPYYEAWSNDEPPWSVQYVRDLEFLADVALARITEVERLSKGLQCFSCGITYTSEIATEPCDQAHREHWGHEWVSQRVIRLTQAIAAMKNREAQASEQPGEIKIC